MEEQQKQIAQLQLTVAYLCDTLNQLIHYDDIIEASDKLQDAKELIDEFSVIELK